MFTLNGDRFTVSLRWLLFGVGLDAPRGEVHKQCQDVIKGDVLGCLWGGGTQRDIKGTVHQNFEFQPSMETLVTLSNPVSVLEFLRWKGHVISVWKTSQSNLTKKH